MSRLSLDVKVSLEGISDDWTADHFMRFHVFAPTVSLTIKDAAQKLEKTDEKGYLELFITHLKEQFVDGQVLVKDETVAAEADDIEALPAETILTIVSAVSRSKYADPKALTK